MYIMPTRIENYVKFNEKKLIKLKYSIKILDEIFKIQWNFGDFDFL